MTAACGGKAAARYPGSARRVVEFGAREAITSGCQNLPVRQQGSRMAPARGSKAGRGRPSPAYRVVDHRYRSSAIHDHSRAPTDIGYTTGKHDHGVFLAALYQAVSID